MRIIRHSCGLLYFLHCTMHACRSSILICLGDLGTVLQPSVSVKVWQRSPYLVGLIEDIFLTLLCWDLVSATLFWTVYSSSILVRPLLQLLTTTTISWNKQKKIGVMILKVYVHIYIQWLIQKFWSGGDWVTPNWGGEHGNGTCPLPHKVHYNMPILTVFLYPEKLRQCVHCLTVFCLACFPCERMACLTVRVDNVTHMGVTRHPIHPPLDQPLILYCLLFILSLESNHCLPL